MKVRVVAFASASDLLGRAPLEVDLAADGRLSDLRDRLLDREPRISKLWPRLAIAIDGGLITGDPVLHDAAEIALLPPVSGG